MDGWYFKNRLSCWHSPSKYETATEETVAAETSTRCRWTVTKEAEDRLAKPLTDWLTYRRKVVEQTVFRLLASRSIDRFGRVERELSQLNEELFLRSFLVLFYICILAVLYSKDEVMRIFLAWIFGLYSKSIFGEASVSFTVDFRANRKCRDIIFPVSSLVNQWKVSSSLPVIYRIFLSHIVR